MRYLASPAQLRASLVRWSLFTVPSVLGLGFLSSLVANAGPHNPWFAALEKPALYPPPETFGIVWSVLYVMIGLALAMVGSARGAAQRGAAMALFIIQLAFNFAWSPVFFALHEMAIALGIIGAMILMTAVMIALFWRVRPLAGALLVPYLAWLCFAAVLNYQFLALNPGADGAPGGGATVRVAI